MNESIQNRNDYIKLRFVGDILDTESLPIYELGSTFIGIQRIFHKAYLFEQKKLERGARLQPDERRKVALQVAGREKRSDAWVLSPFLTDPSFGPVFQALIALGIAGLARYVAKSVMSRSEPKDQQSIFVAAIYNDVVQLTDRIDNIGGVECIEISTTLNTKKPLTIDSGIRDYVRSIGNEVIWGTLREIDGIVTRLHPQINCIDLRINQNRFVEAWLSAPDFHRLRTARNLESRIVRLSGYPLFKLGQETNNFRKFRVKKMIIRRTTA